MTIITAISVSLMCMATPDTGYTLLPAERRESLGGAALHEENEMSEVFHDE